MVKKGNEKCLDVGLFFHLKNGLDVAGFYHFCTGHFGKVKITF